MDVLMLNCKGYCVLGMQNFTDDKQLKLRNISRSRVLRHVPCPTRFHHHLYLVRVIIAAGSRARASHPSLLMGIVAPIFRYTEPKRPGPKYQNRTGNLR